MDINRINTLIESASLLTEDVTSVIKSRTKKITKDAKELAKLFIAGELDPTEAKKLYEATMREINIIKKDINENKLTTKLIDRLQNICTGKVASQIATEAALTAGAYVLGTLIRDKLPTILPDNIKKYLTITKKDKKGNKDVKLTDVVGDGLRLSSTVTGSAAVHTTTKAFSEADVVKQLKDMISDAEKELKYTYNKAYMPQLTESISDILLEAVEILLEDGNTPPTNQPANGGGNPPKSTSGEGQPTSKPSGTQGQQNVIAAVKSNASNIAEIANIIKEAINNAIISIKQISKFRAIPDATVINNIKFNNQLENAGREIQNYVNSIRRGDKEDAKQRADAIYSYLSNNKTNNDKQDNGKQNDGKTISMIKVYVRTVEKVLLAIQNNINTLRGDANTYDNAVSNNLHKWSSDLCDHVNDIYTKCSAAAKSIK